MKQALQVYTREGGVWIRLDLCHQDCLSNLFTSWQRSTAQSKIARSKSAGGDVLQPIRNLTYNTLVIRKSTYDVLRNWLYQLHMRQDSRHRWGEWKRISTWQIVTLESRLLFRHFEYCKRAIVCRNLTIKLVIGDVEVEQWEVTKRRRKGASQPVVVSGVTSQGERFQAPELPHSCW